MLIPPESYRAKGYKVWCVGDDISWIRKGPDGRLYAINPENGFFGVAPGTNAKSNPNALAATRKDTIFTNVVHNLDDNTVWWEGLSKNPPAHAIDWKGNPWNGQEATATGAHANSRFTAPARNCPCISPEFESPNGVPISAFVFGGRREKLAPLVYQARDWAHGVFVGSAMGSETTAAASGLAAGVRRDPMAMLPFCGYNMADYWRHWLNIGQTLDESKAPKFFNVNWFRKDGDGKFMWPGFGDNLRVLEWILDRCEGRAQADETPIGFVPRAEDINLEGIESQVSVEAVRAMLNVDPALWQTEAEGIAAFYAKFEGRVPAQLQQCLAQLQARLG
jgi:phosphoenolpyruvate carboxykinase (GTP)